MAYGKKDKQLAKGSQIGAEGRFKLETNMSAHVVVATAQEPHYWEQTWPEGERYPIIGAVGSGTGETFAGLCLWEFDEESKEWEPKTWEGPLRHLAPLIDLCCDNAEEYPRAAYKVIRKDVKVGTAGWRKAVFEATKIRNEVDLGEAREDWMQLRGRPAGAPEPTRAAPAYQADDDAVDDEPLPF